MPGPTDYTPSQPLKSIDAFCCAPFNVSDVKNSYFDVAETNYGPGSYNSKYYKDLNKP